MLPLKVSKSAVQISKPQAQALATQRLSLDVTPPRPPRASENPPRKRKGKERERIPMMVRGAEEINKKKNYYFIK
jgi:hypothetical protein